MTSLLYYKYSTILSLVESYSSIILVSLERVESPQMNTNGTYNSIVRKDDSAIHNIANDCKCMKIIHCILTGDNFLAS